jgi:hypothetical protein
MCPCCGFSGLKGKAYESIPAGVVVRGGTPPYSVYFGMPSYEVCPCCGYEFGFDDEPGTADPQSFEQYLFECRWLDERRRPVDWSIANQLRGCAIMNLNGNTGNRLADSKDAEGA